MDIPRNDNYSPKRTVEWGKKKDAELMHISEIMVRRRPTAKYVINERKIESTQKKEDAMEEMPKLEREYTRGEMMDLLMTFPHVCALSGTAMVKYNPITNKFYGLNCDFDFSYALPNEKWILSE